MPMSMVAGNWKMNTTLDEAKTLASEIKNGLESTESVEIVVCPPFVSLASIYELLRDSNISVGAQNIHHETSGAFTGEISPTMLAGICKYVILGHSERRQYFGENYDLVNKKVKAALGAELKPIMCVGEKLSDRESGRPEDLVAAQVRAGLDGVEAADRIVIAYEPIWAIGTGRSATPDLAQAMISCIRKTLVSMYGPDIAHEMTILYGGSVTPENISKFIQQPDVNGALVGGASLNAKNFVEITERIAIPS